MRLAFSWQNYALYAGQLRRTSKPHFVVISDQDSVSLSGVTDDSDVIASEFENQMTAKLGRDFYFHAIVSPPGGPGCGMQSGETYWELAGRHRGKRLSICSSDWTSLFASLQQAITSVVGPLPCRIAVPQPPEGSKLDPLQIYVAFFWTEDIATMLPRVKSFAECVEDEDGWYLDGDTVAMCPSSCDALGQAEEGELVVAVGCQQAADETQVL